MNCSFKWLEEFDAVCFELLEDTLYLKALTDFLQNTEQCPFPVSAELSNDAFSRLADYLHQHATEIDLLRMRLRENRAVR